MLGMKALGKVIGEYDELCALLRELEDKKKAAENAMKGELERRGVEELVVGGRVIRNTEYKSQRFDSTGFRKADPETYAAWVKEVTGHRFSVS